MQFNHIQTKFLGKNYYYYDEIDSTQKEIWRLYNKNNIKNGTLVSAGIQTAGKGTKGRVWHTDEKNNIAFSFFIKMDCKVEKIQGITIQIAETILEILEKDYQILLEIKPPNDIFYHHKKIGGILTQSKVFSGRVKALVVGIGLNTSQEVFHSEIQDIATSIKKEFSITINSEEFITAFCKKFEEKIIERIED